MEEEVDPLQDLPENTNLSCPANSFTNDSLTLQEEHMDISTSENASSSVQNSSLDVVVESEGCVQDSVNTSNTLNKSKEESLDAGAEPDKAESSLEISKEAPLSYPEYDYGKTPIQLLGAWKEFSNAFTKGCKWSPDGTCILINSDDNILRLFNFTLDLHGKQVEWDKLEEMRSVLQTKESGTIYDYAWYPFMSSADPATCCFISTSLGNPVHLWDAYTGELRCTYRAYNHVDEVVAANSLAFNPSGEKIYCGFNKTIRIFNLCQPGRNCQEMPTNVKRMGQAGIISCFAFNPDSPNMYAAGSYCKTVGIYMEQTLICLLSGHEGGVTHLAFSSDGTKLFSGGRKDSDILCWDVRNPGKIFSCLKRTVKTNQRIYFELSRCGNFILSGNDNGIVTSWDLRSSPIILEGMEPLVKPKMFFRAHTDCVNGISLHPYFPLYATTSGQRKFPDLFDSSGEEEEEEEKRFFKSVSDTKVDNSLRIWMIKDELESFAS